MDNYEPFLRSPSTTVDIDDVNDDWNDDEEIELGSEEHDLFLRDNYVKPTNNGVLPFRATSPAHQLASQQPVQSSGNNNHQNRSSRNHRSLANNSHQQSSSFDDTSGDLIETDHDIPMDGLNHNNNQKDGSKAESFNRMQDSGRGSPSSSSIVYQVPNFDQFAGNLAPSSPSSILVSMIIIIVILSVTIVPKIFPSISKGDENSNNNGNPVIFNSSAQHQQMEQHADFRCKCICPPPHQLNLNMSTSTNNATNSSSINNDKKHSNITTVSGKIDADKTKKLEHHEDKVANGTTKTQQVNHMLRRLYVGNTTPTQCNCNNIVQPHLTDNKISLKDFCVHCECRYQSRNTTTIKRNVVFFIAVLIGLALYMFIQYLLKYFRITRRSLPNHLKWLSHQVVEGG